jgi:hypothetical protein
MTSFIAAEWLLLDLRWSKCAIGFVALAAADKMVGDHVAKGFVVAVAADEEQVFISNLLRLIPPRASPKTGSTGHV